VPNKVPFSKVDTVQQQKQQQTHQLLRPLRLVLCDNLLC
jgi:hypothetical protein